MDHLWIDKIGSISIITSTLVIIKTTTLKISIEFLAHNFSNSLKVHLSIKVFHNPLISARCSKMTRLYTWEILVFSTHLNSAKTINKISDQVLAFLIKVMDRVWTSWTSLRWYNKGWLRRNRWKKKMNSVDQLIKTSSEVCLNNPFLKSIVKREKMAAWRSRRVMFV